MFCINCGNELKNGEQICSKCGNDSSEKENNITKKEKTKKLISLKCVIIVGIIVAIIVAAIYILTHNLLTENKQGTNENTQKNQQTSGKQATSMSFKNMSSDDEGLSKEQQATLKYFDTYADYLQVSPDELSRYPQLFEQAKVYLSTGVVRVLESTNERFEILAFQDEFGYQFGEYQTEKYTLNGPNSRLCIIKGEQLDERLLENDYIGIWR